MKKRLWVGIAIGLLAGWGFGRGCRPPSATGPAAADGAEVEKPAEVWTCSMHPQIRQPKPGLCPICHMDLVLATMGEQWELDVSEIELSATAQKLAAVETAPVVRGPAAVEVRLSGKLQPDETRVAVIASRVAGRVDQLYANALGLAVKAGDAVADLYSPELVSAAQELRQAAAAENGEAGGILEAARERLRLWGLTAEQIEALERDENRRDQMTFYAPISGVVIAKNVRAGQYVETGEPILAVADLSHLWLLLDAYESDLHWLRVGQAVTFSVAAQPGGQFTGDIAFIEPVVSSATRTVKVRVEVTNSDGQLKPEMFARAVVEAVVGEEGAPPLLIPATAPLLTGARALVYVADAEREGVFAAREIELGPRAGDFYIVQSGLVEGEKVASRGAFKIDSSLQIQGKPSMMAPAGHAAPAGGHGHD